MLAYMTIRTFVQGESRSQVYLDYAEPPPKVHLYEIICKSRIFCCNNGRIVPIFRKTSAMKIANWGVTFFYKQRKYLFLR